MRLIIVGLLGLLFAFAGGVDKNNFKNCDQSSFCRRCRKIEPGNSPYEVQLATAKTFPDHLTVDVVNKENDHVFLLKLVGLKGNKFHVEIDEKTPLKPRYRVVDALKGPPATDNVAVKKEDGSISVECGGNRAVIVASPFRIDFYNGEVLVVSTNAKGLMKFEHLRKKPEPAPLEGEETAEEVPSEENNVVQPKTEEEADPGAWDENFKSHHDSKPNGPEAIAMDFTFPQAEVLFGIPEHADSFALKPTLGSEPYRLYNLDVFEYELDSPMALYGAVPVLYGHGEGNTAGVYWQNAAETWVDIYNANAKKNVMSSIVNFVSRNRQTDPPAGHFMSESGIVDFFVLLGPTPMDAFTQYTDLTGVTALPQVFSLGYHQSRWNYNDEMDVASVNDKFDEHDIPMDTMWLDIEYTDAKKYFTWDDHKFQHPLEMIKNLTERGRHLVIIIDPHIKRDGGYFFHNDCTDRGYYVKNKDGRDYEGWCWPGAASYPDFFNPEVRKYYADQYQLDNFQTTTADVMLWNDMNEPSVFNGPEVTMLKDNIHFGDWEHRDVHNIYGHMHVLATFEGLMRRSNGVQRPFILSRSHFAGTQRYAAIWTGDNAAEWGHLQASVKMCLSESVAGMSFCGADVGGFFGNPDAELFERWYQAGAFLPFFRAHSHIDTRRREPWLMPEATMLVIRDAIRRRYSYLPFWYTLFYEHEKTGYPVMRPLLTHYPLDKETFTIDYEYLLGDVLLVRPVLQQGVSKVDVYFPSVDGKKEGDIWYDVDDYRKITTAGFETVPVNNYKIPVYQRGGTILPKKERVRRAATLMINDPVTLVVALDNNHSAKGTLYVDDEKTYDYRSGKYIYVSLEFKDNVLTSRKNDEKANYDTKSWVERVVIVGLEHVPKSATLSVSGEPQTVTLEVNKHDQSVIIRKPGVVLSRKWSIQLNY
ncbi:neutral alpha-glucosidase AB [Phlebotomus argentipes]|uniref:neutral alpha-glucosidase AB n=1 Tax=Phlebotomus argentipes TaxID=94469 RepID=UPI00289309D2|nr:neutral alpha-glucosidase AB [Phlebotomus argentipes]XP_059616185.1 neutral alpha-glucosidase AB [Phlebotomus argentipes]